MYYVLLLYAYHSSCPQEYLGASQRNDAQFGCQIGNCALKRQMRASSQLASCTHVHCPGPFSSLPFKPFLSSPCSMADFADMFGPGSSPPPSSRPTSRASNQPGDDDDDASGPRPDLQDGNECSSAPPDDDPWRLLHSPGPHTSILNPRKRSGQEVQLWVQTAAKRERITATDTEYLSAFSKVNTLLLHCVSELADLYCSSLSRISS